VPARGTETVLLVEDEDVVRELVYRALERQGYTVLAARLPQQALVLMQHYVGPVALLVTDVVMPGMNGPDLAQRLRRLRPDLQVMYISGYADDALSHHGVLEPGIVLLSKPFGPNEFVQAVREVLDAAASSSGINAV
jgi:CheY-like chemotaxis protein